MPSTRFEITTRTEEVSLHGSQRRAMRGWRVFLIDDAQDRVIESSPFFPQYADPKAAQIERAKRDAWIEARS